MSVLFYVSGVVAIIAALLVVTRLNAMHALVALVVLFLAIASVFFTLGGPFVAVLQIIIYAGAIMVLFVFVVMMLNLGGESEARERRWMSGAIWVAPALLAALLLAQLILTLACKAAPPAGSYITPKAVGISLYTDYLIGVELASLLLVAALIGAYHLGVLRRRPEE